MIKGTTCLGIDAGTGIGSGLGELLLFQNSLENQRLLASEANKQNK